MKQVVLNFDKYSKESGYTKEKLQKAISEAIKKVNKAIDDFDGLFAASNSKNNVYPPDTNYTGDWNQGFWTGILWLSYELTGNEKYKKIALSHIPSFYKRIDEKIGINHHDMGFLYTPSCVAAYKLCGDETAKKAAIMAADWLLTRYHEKGRFIQAWGDVSDPKAYRLIVDCLLNIPLLYWASEVTGDSKYDKAAYNHFRTTIENAFRDDGSTYHTFYFDPETGAPKKGVTSQGFSDNSCWSRGQAWGIYGTMLTRAYHDDPDIIPTTKNLANYFLNRMPEDCVAYWDLVFGDGSGEPRDSSASAIAVCGILEMIKFLPDTDDSKAVYENAVNLIMDSLYENYSTKDCPESNGLLLHAVYSKPANIGVDECNIWGCYFYMEALTRLAKDWKLYW